LASRALALYGPTRDWLRSKGNEFAVTIRTWHGVCKIRCLGFEHRNSSGEQAMIRKLKTGEFRLYSRKADPKTGKRRNLGTFKTRDKAEQHERAVQHFKHHG
jgi:hypothetical protein